MMLRIARQRFYPPIAGQIVLLFSEDFNKKYEI